MADELAPVTVEDFLVPLDEEQKPQPEVVAAETPDDAGGEDLRSDEERLIDELAASDEEGDGEAAQEEEVPPPPSSWSKDDAEAWKGLTPAARDVVMRREAERDRFIADSGRKNAAERQRVENDALQAVAKHADDYAQRLATFMQRNMPQVPDERLLYTGNPDDVLIYQRQDAAYRSGLAQQQTLQHEIGQSQQQADAARKQASEAMNVVEAQRLQETLPEFFDPEAGPKLRQTLESIGGELGYPPELMAQAGATDILALKKAAEWRDDAMKYRKIMAKRMESVRDAKKLPRMTRPGADQSSVVAEVSDERRSAAIAQFQRDRSGDAALALLAKRTR